MRGKKIALADGVGYNICTSPKFEVKKEPNMARYEKLFPVVDSPANSFGAVQRYLESKGYKYRDRDGEQVFQKGDGVWVAARFIKVTYRENRVCLEAWIDAMGAEQGLDGFVGAAVKKPLKKEVMEIEQILSSQNPDYVPGQVPNEAPVAAAAPAPQPTKVQLPGNITKKEYFEKYAGESFYRDLKVAAITSYVCAGLNAIISLVLWPFGLIDSVVVAILALCMHLYKNKGCAIAILAYAGCSTLIGLINTGVFSGYLGLAAGVIAVIAFVNAEKRYKKLTGR